MLKIIAIGAHPDDIEYGCGGTLFKLSKAGHQITMLVMTRGEMGGDPDLRQKEQERSAALLNARLVWGRFADTQIPLQKEAISTIEYFIKKIKPDLIFVMFAKDTHQDHRTVSQATVTAARYVHNVLFYEVPTTYDFAPASVFMDIAPVLDKKMTLLKAHKSQVFATRIANLSILEASRSTALFRGVQNRVTYAEGFVPLRLSIDHIHEF
jgi:LmbE family N-acetylglucosaminyl deacetylase